MIRSRRSRARARARGPYTVENAERYLDEESVELYNGWLVWQEITDAIERRIVNNMQEMLAYPPAKLDSGKHSAISTNACWLTQTLSSPMPASSRGGGLRKRLSPWGRMIVRR